VIEFPSRANAELDVIDAKQANATKEIQCRILFMVWLLLLDCVVKNLRYNTA
jgi:hypothetical protein